MHKIEIASPIAGLALLEPKVFGDARGFFMETYRRDRLAELGIHDEFVQDNHSSSTRGVLRGLHYQRRRCQAKLVRVLRGRVLDVAVDIRPGSPTFGRFAAVELSEENRRMFYVLKAGREPEILAEIEMPDALFAGATAADETLFVPMNGYLYAVRNNPF